MVVDVADLHIVEEWTVGFSGGLRTPSALLVLNRTYCTIGSKYSLSALCFFSVNSLVCYFFFRLQLLLTP